MVLMISAEIEVILYTVDNTIFGKNIICVHDTVDIHD